MSPPGLRCSWTRADLFWSGLDADRGCRIYCIHSDASDADKSVAADSIIYILILIMLKSQWMQNLLYTF